MDSFIGLLLHVLFIILPNRNKAAGCGSLINDVFLRYPPRFNQQAAVALLGLIPFKAICREWDKVLVIA